LEKVEDFFGLVGGDKDQLFFFFFYFLVDEGVGLEVVHPFDFCGEFGFEESGNEFFEFSSVVGKGDEHLGWRKDKY
jgi:hypothetical protein